jgi:hypothetical protein
MDKGALPHSRPLSRPRGRGVVAAATGVRVLFPTAYAMGYDLTPLTGLRNGRPQVADLINKFLPQDTGNSH